MHESAGQKVTSNKGLEMMSMLRRLLPAMFSDIKECELCCVWPAAGYHTWKSLEGEHNLLPFLTSNLIWEQ